MCPWAYAQRVIFWVLERTLKQRLSVRSNSDWAYAHTAIERTLKGSFFGSLSVRSKGHFLGPWAYAQRVIFWVLECMLKGLFLSLSICSKGNFLGPWAYADTAIEHMLQGLFFGSLSIHSMSLFLGPWAYAQRIIFWVIELTLKWSTFFAHLSRIYIKKFLIVKGKE